MPMQRMRCSGISIRIAPNTCSTLKRTFEYARIRSACLFVSSFERVPLVINARLETAFAKLLNPILRAIRTVRQNLSDPNRTVGQKLPEYRTVVAARRRHRIPVNEFRVAVHRHMVLVAVTGLAALLRPARIGVFLPQLVRLPLSLLRHLALLHRRMVLATVALARHLHDQRGL